jgi:heme/copper-type cytochrome/quinol oxidase subunit 3
VSESGAPPTAAALSPARRRVLDVSALPDYAFGHQGLIWWGTIGFMVIEGSLFIMSLVTYFVFRTRVSEWPPAQPNPDATLATVNTLVLLVSLLPNALAKRSAEKMDLRGVHRWMFVMLLFGAVFLTIRAFEFRSLATMWDSNAYGSIVWFIMGLHSAHLLTDVVDSAVLLALMYTRHVEPKRFVDVSENSLYWYFIVLSWIPVYVTIYFAPRWL